MTRVRSKRRANKAFAPPSGASSSSRRTPWRNLLLLGAVPALFCLSHLLFGANQPVAALWLATVVSLIFSGSLLFHRVRIVLFDTGPLMPAFVLFGVVIGVALWTLTPWTPGGPHPIWAWAGMGQGASTVNRSATIVEIIKLLSLACVFGLGCVQAARAGTARTTIEALLMVGAAYAAISLLTFLAGLQIMQGGRLSGGFLSANSGGTVMGVFTVIALANLLRRWRQGGGLGLFDHLSRVSVPLGYVLLFLTCLLLTASRMGVAATLVAASALMLWELFDTKGRRGPILVAGSLLLVVGLVLLLGGNDLVWMRMDQIGSDTLVRQDIFGAHWQAFLDSPLFGYGLGSFGDMNSQIMSAETYRALWAIRAVHNVYLQWLVEAGIVGAVPMFLLIAWIIGVAIWRSFRLHSGQTLLRGLLAANLVVLIHGTTDFALQVPSIAAFWAFLLGLQFAFGQSRS